MGMINSLTSSLAGMKTAQAQLDLISRNVSNVDTEGYSRKVANQKNVIIGGFSQGVSLGTVTRQVDQGLLKSYLVSSAASSSLSAQSEYVSKAETLLGSPQDNNSVAANVASLQAAFEKFATDVSSSSSRYELISQAETITNRLNYISKELQKLRADADIAIADEVKEVNSILEKLNDLNNEIVKYSVKGSNDTADLEDQRDQLLRSLSEKIDINYFTRDNGEMVIQTTDGITLLDDQVHPLSHNSISQASSITMYEAGNIDGIYVDGKDITSQIKSGSLAGLIEVRDSTLSSLQSQIDELAGSLKDQINQIHNRGTSYPDTPDTLTGSRTFISPSTQTISIENGDVRFVIFDDSGKQVATASLKGDLGFTSGVIDDTDVNGNRPDDSTSLAGTLERWLKESPEGPQLQDAKVYVNSDGKLVIETGDSNYGLSIIDESGETLSVNRAPKDYRHAIWDYDFVGACFMYTREVYQTIGEYDPEMFLCEDYDYWLRIFARFDVEYIDEDLYAYRQHGGSLSQTHRYEQYEMLEKVLLKNFAENKRAETLDRFYLYRGLNRSRSLRKSAVQRYQYLPRLLCYKIWHKLQLH